jgi:DNA replication factor GINS
MRGKMDDEVTITYETLFELLRREKDRGELQKLDENFFRNVLRYLKDKQTIIVKQNEGFSSEERRRTEDQMDNVRRIIREIYDKREKKIIGLAIEKSRNKASIVDNSVFLKEERELFENVLKVLSIGRDNVLSNVLALREPSSQEFSVEKKEKIEEKRERATRLVRFLNAVPKFVGKELEEYGPFEEEDVASLPIEIANVLITKGRAEEISED